MNSVKTVVVVGLLLGVGYWVYNSIHNKQAPPIPEEMAGSALGEVTVELPELPSAGMPQSLGGNAPPFGDGSAFPAAVAAPAPPFGAPSATPGGVAASAPVAPNPPEFRMPEEKLAASSQPDQGPAPPFSPQSQPQPTGDNDAVTAAEPAGSQVQAYASQNAQASAVPSVDDELEAIFAEFMQAIERDLQQGKLEEAHRMLSRWYGNPQLAEAQQRQITDLLDEVAGVVVYSREPCLAEAHVVQAGDTLPSIAAKYDVPWQLLAKINCIADPQNLVPGQVLKVVPGPFEALIDLSDHEMTLRVKGLYAGRFPVGVGRDADQIEGDYEVQAKVMHPVHRGPSGTFDAGDPANPLGDRKLDLDGRIAIHGTNDPSNVGTSGGPGTICLAPEDIGHVYDILSVGSRVTIRR